MVLSGRIIEICDYKFIHKLYTKSGSSGSPIVNDYLNVIGIHHSGDTLLHQNEGIFIGKILDNLKGSSAFSDKYRYFHLNYHLNEHNNNNINNNNINTNNNYKNLNRNSNNYAKKYNLINPFFKSQNFIHGEVFIKEKQVNEKIKIIILV